MAETKKKPLYFDGAVIEAGPAGLMAAVECAKQGARVVILESGPKPGRKLLATGGGRCNITHAGTRESFLEGFDKKGARFLKPALYLFSPQDTFDYFTTLGIKLKTERGARVFPASDRADEILSVLLREAASAKVEIKKHSKVTSVSCKETTGSVSNEENGYKIVSDKYTVRSRSLIIATGGLSMKRSGSTGDGYRFAESLGHTIVELRPSLIPLITKEKWPGSIAGLSLKNVKLSASLKKKKISRFGEMLFTHTGIGGPITLEVSRFLTDILYKEKKSVYAEIDLKPALDDSKLDARLLREIKNSPKRKISGLVKQLMPASLAEVYVQLSGLDKNLSVSELGKNDRSKLRHLIKALPLTITGTEPVEKALITRGGVNLKEIDSKTMSSKICCGLFFAGEVIDVDGDCGGFNLQMCWSTGKLAGKSAAEYLMILNQK